MDQIDKGISIPVTADVSGFTDALNNLERQSSRFGSVFTSTIRGAIISGRSFEDTLRSLGTRLSSMALSAGLKPLENLASGAIQSIFSSLSSAIPSANGNVVSSNGIMPFAKGGVVAAPTYFSAGSQLGVMGEAGAEAIMPLSRGSDGRLGVRMEGSSSPVNIVFNVTATDAASFRKSEAQISTMLTRTVSRGRRGL